MIDDAADSEDGTTTTPQHLGFKIGIASDWRGCRVESSVTFGDILSLTPPASQKDDRDDDDDPEDSQIDSRFDDD